MIEFLEQIILPYPKSILLFLIGIINACWLFYIIFFKRNFRQKIYRAYFYSALAALLWVLTNAYAESKLFTSFGGIGLRYTFALAGLTTSFAITGFYYLSELIKTKNQPISFQAKIFIGVMLVQSFIFNLVPGIAVIHAKVFTDGNFELVQGPYFFIFYIFLVAAIVLGFRNILVTFQKIKRKKRSLEARKFAHIGIGISFMYGTAIIFHMIIPYFFYNYSYSWVPPAFSILDILIVGYGVLAQRFRSVILIVLQTVKFMISFFLAFVAASLSFFLLQLLIKNEQIPVLILSALVFLLVFLKIYKLVQSPTFGQLTTIEQFQSALAELKQKNVIYDSFKEFEKELQQIFCRTFGIESADIILLNEEKKKTYKNLFKHFQKLSNILVTKEIQLLENTEKKLLPFSEELASLGEICLPLYSPNQEIIALFVLGGKPFDAIYTKEEIEAVEGLSSFLSLNLAAILYNFELKQEIKNKTRDLQEQYEHIKNQNRKIGTQNKEISALLAEKIKLLAQQSDFLALTAHELRTPLSLAILYADQLTTYSHIQETQEIHSDIDGLKRSLKKLKNLTNKLFQVLQFDLEKINLTLEKTNMNEFIERIYEDFQPLMKEKNLTFILQNKLKRDLIAYVDPVYLRQLLQNYLTNAIKYCPVGGKIILSTKETRTTLAFFVADNGEGVPDKSKEEIFKKFKSNHTMQSPGLGLGLYTCQQIAKLHHGRVWVEDNPEGGAIFGVELKKTQSIKEKVKKSLSLKAGVIPKTI